MQTHLAGSAGFHCASSKKQLKTRQPAQSSGPAQSGGHYDIDLVVAVCCGNKPLPDYIARAKQQATDKVFSCLLGTCMYQLLDCALLLECCLALKKISGAIVGANLMTQNDSEI